VAAAGPPRPSALYSSPMQHITVSIKVASSADTMCSKLYPPAVLLLCRTSSTGSLVPGSPPVA
jgi:hypothetical protein